MNFIKNRTPYIGKIKLKFEKHPHYTGQSKLNKVHLNLGFTKLVSRIYPERTLSGWVVDPIKVDLINKHTGGVIGDHLVKHHEPKDEFILTNSFLTKDGRYVGSIEEGWWYYTSKLKVCEDYPHGVAEKYENDELVGYYGYTHRGGQTFRIGDKIFDENWKPNEFEIDSDWIDYYELSTDKTFNINEEGILERLVSYISFTERGEEKIKTMEDAKQAAINLSKYLS